jgi:hypothetical protein
MTDYQMTILVQGAVKSAIVSAGALCIFLGYRLFVKGVYEGGARINVQAGAAAPKDETWKAVLAMDKGGPGLIFALFGALIVAAESLGGMDSSEKMSWDVDKHAAAAVTAMPAPIATANVAVPEIAAPVPAASDSPPTPPYTHYSSEFSASRARERY